MADYQLSLTCAEIDNVLATGDYLFTYVCDPDEADQGAAGNGNSLKDLIDTIGTSKICTIVFPHHQSDGNTTTYTLSTSETVPDNFYLKIEPGAILNGGGTLTMSSPSQLLCGVYQIFGSTITVTFSYGGEVWADWFGDNTTPGTTDMAAAIQEAVTSNANNTIRFKSGIYAIGTGITAGNRARFVGAGADTNSLGTELKATGVIDMLTYPGGSYFFTVSDVRFNGNSVATTGLKVAHGAGLFSGRGRIDNVEFKDCATAIHLDTVYQTYVKASILGSSSYGIYLTDDCESNDIYVLLQDCATYFYGNNLRFSRVFIHASHDSTATRTLARFIHLEGGSSFNNFVGYLEVGKENPSAGDMVFIDESSYNSFDDMYFLNIGGFDAYDTFVIGDSGNTQCLHTKIRGCFFAAVDAANYHVNIGYASYTVIDNCISGETDLVVKVNEPDYYARGNKNIGILAGNQVETTSTIYIKPSHTGKTINVDATSGNLIAYMPRDTMSEGVKVIVRKTDVSANTVTLTRTGGVFYPSGGTTIVLTAQYDWAEVENRGGDWYLLGNVIT